MAIPGGIDTDLTVAAVFRMIGVSLTVINSRDGGITERISSPPAEEVSPGKSQALP